MFISPAAVCTVLAFTTLPAQEGVLPAAQAANDWLVGAQLADGHWTTDRAVPRAEREEGDAEVGDEFWEQALAGGMPKVAAKAPVGNVLHDVGVTGLATLALLEGAGLEERAPVQVAAARAVDWLILQQDGETGLLGPAVGHAYHYDHAIASLALVEALQLEAVAMPRKERLKVAAQAALNYIARARNPYQVWRYEMPPVGENDTSVTTWMTLALVEGRRAGLAIDAAALDCVLEWIDSMTSAETGAVGYTERGSTSSRLPGVNTQFPAHKYATMTAAGLLCRLQVGQSAKSTPAIVAHVKHMLTKLPEAPQPKIEDALWVYFGTRAMCALGSLPSKKWTSATVGMILGAQEQAGAGDGAVGRAFPPAGAWGFSSGRTGTTALMSMSLFAAAAVERSDRSADAGVVEPAGNEAARRKLTDGPDSRRVQADPGAVARAGGEQDSHSDGEAQGAIKDGLAWLRAHQDRDGKWDADAFFKHDQKDDKTDGAGEALQDIGVTGLALLAFLGDGSSMTRGPDSAVVVKAVKYLIAQQHRETGLIGEPVGHTFHYGHAIATLALSETYSVDRSMILRDKVQKAAVYILRVRNPYAVWRYESPPDGSNDTSITAWMIKALVSVEESGIDIDREAYTATKEWLDEMTDAETGRVGYTEAGSRSSRVPGLNEQYSTESSEALTAAALLCRFMLGQIPEESAAMVAHADLILKMLPVWSDDGLTNDQYYWYFANSAMYGMGGRYWELWHESALPVFLKGQRASGAAKGSWDPIGPWGYAGGRVYSTALSVLSLESSFRNTSVTTSR